MFAVGALYEAAVALGWIAMGNEPGEEASGQAVATVATLLAVLATIVLSVLRARGRAFATIPVAAAAWTVAHFYAFDSYYLPSRERFSETGAVSPLWVYGVTLAGLGVALLSRRTSVLAPVYVVVCTLTVIGMGIGH